MTRVSRHYNFGVYDCLFLKKRSKPLLRSDMDAQKIVLIMAKIVWQAIKCA